MNEPTTTYLLTFKCPDQLGVVARYSGLLYECGVFITEVSNYTDPVTEMFFLRCVFDDRAMGVSMPEFRKRWQNLADQLNIEYTLRAKEDRPKVVIAVSKTDHCLSVLLTRWKSGALPADIVAVVSNHEDCRALTEFYQVPYYHLPVTPETKVAQEAQLWEILQRHECELLVLARYMQILSDDLCAKLSERVINIHHSFLPGFKGARPYHRAYDRG